ncbi:MAG: Verru_Chthon cassette protein A, partial [Proteobacteria bacterium]|nr:Verru_Chthon cassette protein A [Pseudomonadota bacterium]
DELAFAATNSSTTRQTNSSPLTPNRLAGLRFFLTTSSKASEVNMFNLPRISLWPLNDTNAANTNTVNPYRITTSGTARWSSVDKLMAMASTINGFPYYFTRYDPSDQTNDFQGRNVVLYNYLANLLQSPIPGYSNSFSSRWGANATYETATVCFDYIRSCINTVDSYGTNTSGGDASSAAIRYAYSYTVPPTNTVVNTTIGGTANDPGINAFIPGLGQVVPIKIVTNGITTRGIGRFPVLKSATLAFVAVAADQPPLMVDTITRKPLSPAQVNPLHPFPTTISASSVLTNGFWETVASKSLTISPGNPNNGNTNTYQVVSGNNQFPSWFPTNANVYYIAPGSTNSTFISSSNYVIQLGTNPYFDFKFTPPSTVSINTNYISYQVGSHSFLGISGGVTVTHPGLVYGGDLDTNTGAFDLYNAYFSTTAGLIPGLGTTNNSFTYTNLIKVSNSDGKLITNFTTAVNPLPVANSNSTLFPKLYQTVMQPVLILDYGLPSPGYAPYYANFKVRVTGLGNFKVDGTSFFGSGSYGDCNTNANPYSDYVGSCSGPEMSLADKNNAYTNGVATGNWPFYGNFVKTSASSDPTGKTFAFTGGNLKVEFLKTRASYTTASSNDIIQTINLNFPNATFPTPKLSPYNGMIGAGSYYLFGTNDTSGNWVSGCPLNMPLAKYLMPTNSTIIGSDKWSKSFPYNALFLQDLGTNYNATANTFRSVEVTYGDWRLPAMMQTVPAATTPASGGPSANSLYTINDSKALYTPHRLYFASSSEPGLTSSGYAVGSFFWRSAHTLVGSSAEGRMVPGTFLQGLNNANSYGGDPGMIYNLTSSNSTWPKNLWDHLFLSDSEGNSFGYPLAGSTVDFTGNISSSSPFTTIWASGGDFDDPPGNIRSAGPFINKSDEGSAVNDRLISANKNWGSVGRTRFAPNLMVPSAGILGSLPVGFDPANPSITNAWRTLLFCPNPNSPSHSSLDQMPPDYMIMDLFRIPVVQPYPLGDALATAGRVNLNYQIAPFTYIHRDSALRGVLKSVDIAAVRDDDGDVYKGAGSNALPSQFSTTTNYYAYRFPVHLDQTLQQFDAKFATNGFFRSGAEICSMWLYPAVAPGDTASQQTNPATALVTDTPGSTTSISNWWYTNPGTARKGLTGDNARERPYAGIYANVTTKSNVYQIHYRVQMLKQTPAAHPGAYNTFIDPAKGGMTDKVVGELRGSEIIERYLDPSDPNLPDFAGRISSGGISAVSNPSYSLDSYYRFRVYDAKQLTP